MTTRATTWALPLAAWGVVFFCGCSRGPAEPGATPSPVAEEPTAEVEESPPPETTPAPAGEEAAEPPPPPSAAAGRPGDVALLRRALDETGGDPSRIADDHHTRCIARPAYTDDVVVVGSFAHDRGCAFLGIFIGEEFSTDRRGSAAALLARPAFTDVDDQHKRLYAMSIVGGVLMAFAGGDMPAAESTDDGGVSIRVTTRRPGKRAGDPVEHHFLIAADGTLRDAPGP